MAVYNRDEFLNKLAAKLGRPRRTEGVVRPVWRVNPQYEVFKGMDQEELMNIFANQCEAIHTDFVRTDVAHLKNVLVDVIRRYGGKSVILPKDPRNEKYGLPDCFHELQQDTNIHVWDYTIGKENEKIAEQANIGITFSDITLAETATVTLFHNKHHGRSISLMPKNYIAIIPKSTLVPRMTQAAAIIHEKIEKGELVASCVSFISGPSNSADIEMNLIVGVHGPVKATYILVDD